MFCKSKTTSLQKKKNATEINSFVSRFIYLPALPFSLITGIAGSAYGVVLSLLFLIEKQGYIENAEMYFVAYTCTVVIARIIGGELGDKKGAGIVVPLLTLVRQYDPSRWRPFRYHRRAGVFQLLCFAGLLGGCGDGVHAYRRRLQPHEEGEEGRGVGFGVVASGSAC